MSSTNTASNTAAAPEVIGGATCQLRAREYTHVEDTDSCEVLTLLGPLVFPLKACHRVLPPAPLPCVVVPPAHYVIVLNPVLRTGEEASGRRNRKGAGYPLVCKDDDTTSTTQSPLLLRQPTVAVARPGQREIRFSQPPFPLFPGEALEGPPAPLLLLRHGEALLLTCTEAFAYSDEDRARRSAAVPEPLSAGRSAGDRYYFKGPGHYYPRVEERQEGRLVTATVLSAASQAAYVTAIEAFTDETATTAVQRRAGETWTVRTTGAYFPPPRARVAKVVAAVPLPPRRSLLVEALGDFTDHYTGEERRAGQRWLVTRESVGSAYVPCHLEHIHEDSRECVDLADGTYCVVLNPSKKSSDKKEKKGGDGTEWGGRELRVDPCSFYLGPSEQLVGGAATAAFALSKDEALLVEAREAFTDATGADRAVASRWLVRGHCSYTPELAVRPLELRHVILLNQKEGVYVRNTRTGEIKSVHGRPFMLSEDEELWEKPVSRYVRRLMAAPRQCIRALEEPDIIADWELSTRRDAQAMLMASSESLPGSPMADTGFVRGWGQQQQQQQPQVNDQGVREQPTDTRRYAVVSVNVDQNTFVRLQDTNKGTSRVVAGPAAVTLEPYEEFTRVSLSGGRPKEPHQIHALSLFLGPDYMSDMIEVETLDHARLKLELAYNWELDTADLDGALSRVFTIPDFIGEACKTLASRVRVAIASATFESFHRNSSAVVRQAIFSAAADGSTEVRGDSLYFLVNGLRITNVDLQSVEPVDKKTRSALAKSVQLAVEIITKSQENEATHRRPAVPSTSRSSGTAPPGRGSARPSCLSSSTTPASSRPAPRRSRRWPRARPGWWRRRPSSTRRRCGARRTERAWTRSWRCCAAAWRLTSPTARL